MISLVVVINGPVANAGSILYLFMIFVLVKKNDTKKIFTNFTRSQKLPLVERNNY